MTTVDARLLQRNTELTILRHIAETLNRATDVQIALDDTLESVVKLLELQTAWVFLMDDVGAFYLAASRALPPALTPGSPAWSGGCNCNGLFRRGELQQAINIVQCSRLAEAAGNRHGLEFHASVPLWADNQVIGILNVASPGSDRFTTDVLELLGAVGYQLGTAIERARLARQALRMAALEERNRIARELHDTVAQGLTAITLHLEAAEALAGQNPEQAQRNIRLSLALARTNLEEVRRSMLDLRAAPLEEHTLPEAIDMLLRAFGDETGIAVALNADPALGRFASPLETGLYRIVQEALSNIRKHAAATAVAVRLAQEDGQISLQIEDNGAGFDINAVRQHSDAGFGLRGMNERARLLGGRLQICSTPGSGAKIDVVVPVVR